MSKMNNSDRYSTVGPDAKGEWYTWDHEEAERVPDRDGRDRFTNFNDAQDLTMEHRG